MEDMLGISCDELCELAISNPEGFEVILEMLTEVEEELCSDPDEYLKFLV